MCATIISKHTGKSLERVMDDSERDFFMSPTEALEYGLIDKVLEPSRPDTKK